MVTAKAMRFLRLKEYARYPCEVPLSQEQRQALSKSHITVSASQSKEGTYELTPSSYVGAVNVGDLSVIIRPKIKIDRVMFMMTYAMDPENWNKDESVELDPADDVLEAVALSFTHRTEQAIKRGLLRGYRREEDTLNTVRGQIRFSDQIRRRYDLPLPIELAYDEYTEDIEQNRLLKTALHRLSLTRIRNEAIANKIRRLRPAFDMVQLGLYAPAAVPAIRYTRLDEHYRPAVELARLIIENSSLELPSSNVSSRSVSSATFLVNMNLVFEDFLRVALREALGLSESQWKRGQNLQLDEGKRINMEPDLSWWPTGSSSSGSLPCFVGDAKYKKLDDTSFKRQGRHNFRHADIYQMLAYCTAAHLRSGLLIYAEDGDESSEPGNSGKYRIKHAGITIEVNSLSLSGTPMNILGEVGRLAERVRDHAAASSLKIVA